MAHAGDAPAPAQAGDSRFPATHWSVVLAAGHGSSTQAAAALESLCRAYWHPLYVFILGRGHSPEEAEDLTQGFFAHLLEKQALGQLTREGAKFRSFLLTALKHFLANEWAHECARKRDQRRVAVSLDAPHPETGHRLGSVEETTPETLFDRQWAATIVERALERLKAEQEAEGKGDLFERVHTCLTGAESTFSYADLGTAMGMTGSAVKMAVHRLRRRYGELLRAEIAQTVVNPSEVDEEIRYFIAIMAR